MMPAQREFDFSGVTYDSPRDKQRLNRQLLAVQLCMADGQWKTLREISEQSGAPEASASARLRDLRRKLGMNVEKKNLGGGRWAYRVKI
jgi:hypothetical protein